MTPQEFLEAVQDRIEWIKDCCPELMDRPVMAYWFDKVGSDMPTAFKVERLFVEEFLNIEIEVSE
jgi:hypothetical protein